MKYLLFFLRISLGWLFFYSGITKVLDPQWSAISFLSNANTLPDLFNWFGLESNIGLVNFVNEWGLVLIGVSLIFGIFVRWSTIAGVILMVLYYLGSLSFPYVNETSFIVDNHIIYIFCLLILFNSRAGKNWGFDKYIRRR